MKPKRANRPTVQAVVLREVLARFAHNQWAGWMEYLFSKSTENPDGTVTIPAWAVTRWKRQVATDYADLCETEKNSDRLEADAMIEKFQENNRIT